MRKTTVYLPEELDARLEAEAKAEGVSKAELILSRRGPTAGCQAATTAGQAAADVHRERDPPCGEDRS